MRSSYRYGIIPALGLALVVAACTDTPTVPAAGPASLNLSHATVTLDRIGETAELSATVLDTDGEVLEGATLVWESLSEQVAEVSDGTVTSTGVGTTHVVASYEGAADTAVINSRQTIDESGGKITSGDGRVLLSIPTGALQEETAIGIEAVEENLPARGIEGTVYRFTPAGVEFAEPVQLRIELMEADVPADVAASRIVWHGGSDSDDWDAIPHGQVDLEAGTATLALTSFSLYGLGIGPGFAQIDAGLYHACALDMDGIAYCWGRNSAGQLGVSVDEVASSVSPIAVNTTARFASIHVADDLSCGLTAAREAYCWGAGIRGQIGDGGATFRDIPARVAGGHTFERLHVGGFIACGETTDGLYCWGDNRDGAIGAEPTAACGPNEWPCNPTPTRVQTELSFSQVTVGMIHVCGLTSNGRAYCWGWNTWRQLGDGTGESRSRPTPVETDVRFSSIEGGAIRTCATSTDDATYCWGSGMFGGLGLGEDVSLAPTPGVVLAGSDLGPLSLATENSIFAHSCTLDNGGQVHCWGADRVGQLGTTDPLSSCDVGGEAFGCAWEPVRSAPDRRFLSISASAETTCGIKEGGEAWCWGHNALGKLGRGANPDDQVRGEPARVLFPWETEDTDVIAPAETSSAILFPKGDVRIVP